MGRTDRGFDFLGYHFGPEGLAVAQKTLEHFVERAIRFYEQEPGEPWGSTRLGEYAKRWVRLVLRRLTGFFNSNNFIDPEPKDSYEDIADSDADRLPQGSIPATVCDL